MVTHGKATALAEMVPVLEGQRVGLARAVGEPVLQVWGECVPDFDYCIEDGEEDGGGDAGRLFSLLAKRYLDGRFVACADLRVQLAEPFDLHPCYLRATLRCAPRRGDSFPEDADVSGRIEAQVLDLAGGQHGRIEAAVLVGVGHPEQAHEVVFFPRLVALVSERLEGLDVLDDLVRQSCDGAWLERWVALLDILRPLGEGIVDRELGMVGVRVTVGDGDGIDHVIERGPEVVEIVPQMERPGGRRGLDLAPLEDDPAILKELVLFPDGGVEIALNKASCLNCDGIEMRYRPFELQDIARAARVEGVVAERDDVAPLDEHWSLPSLV